MIPREFRLDSVCVHLIERLEGARRSYVGRPDEACVDFRRIAEEHVASAAAEAGEYVDAAGHPEALRREVLETFLPRYTRLALEHNRLEAARFGAWRAGDPLARVVCAGSALLAAVLLMRVLPAVLEYPLWASVPVALFMPELRAAWHRWQYQRELQAVVDDMGRIQDQLGVYQPSAGTAGIADDASPNEQRAALRAARAAARAAAKE